MGCYNATVRITSNEHIQQQEGTARAVSFCLRKMKSDAAFYKSTRWKKLREKILRRDKYMCQVSKRYGKLKEAQTVHHIFPRDRWPEYQFKDWNLISLCSEAHDAMHIRRSNELSEEGKKLLIRTCRTRGMDIPEEYK